MGLLELHNSWHRTKRHPMIDKIITVSKMEMMIFLTLTGSFTTFSE